MSIPTKIVMFPGQGSQYPGMGRELFDKYSDHVDLASLQLGYDVKAVCLESDNPILNDTRYTQPLLYVVCCLEYLHQGLQPDLLIGHSLGLYPALFASGIVDFEQGLKLTEKRAALMAESVNGSMLAVIGLRIDELKNLLISNEYYDVDIANDNSPMQQVVSGNKQSLQQLQHQLTQQVDCRAIPLQVSGAFHSHLMEDAAQTFFAYISDQVFNEPNIPVISSTHGETLSTSHLLEELTFQLTKPVRWRPVIQALLNEHSDAEFIEVGPGNVLTKLFNQIHNSTTVSVSASLEVG